MANNLFIYSKQLNAGNGVYNINATNGLTYLNTYLVHSTEIDNYRINSNTLKLLIHKTLDDGGINASDLNKCCYCYWSTTGTFYFIDNYVIQSGYVLFYLTKDLWGTYFKKAVLSNLCIGRTNKKLTGINGLYENIPCTNEETIEFLKNSMTYYSDPLNPSTAVLEDIEFKYLSAVIALKYNVYEWVNGTSVSMIGLFAIPFSSLNTKWTNTPDTNPTNILDLMQRVVGGVYGLEGYNVGGSVTTLDADIIGCWIIPNAFIYASNSNYILHSRTGIEHFDDITFTLYTVHPYQADDTRYTMTFDIETDANYNLCFGTYGQGFEIPRTIDNVTVKVKFIIETSSVKVVAQVGDTEKDITNAFVLTVTNTDGNISNSAHTLNAIMSGLKFAGAGATAIASAKSGNALGVVTGSMGIVGGLTGMEQSMQTIKTNGLVNNGDALTSFYKAGFNTSGRLRNPFILHKYLSIRNEEDIVIHKGAIYDYFSGTNLLSDVYNEDPIITGDTETYIKCSEITVDGIPSEAREYIAGKLTNGIYIINEA